jgi:hypothetical protein
MVYAGFGRHLAGLVASLVLAVIVVCLYQSGVVTLPEYWTQLAVGLSLLIPVVLLWTFKPEIYRWFASRKQKQSVQLQIKINTPSLGDPQTLTELLAKSAERLTVYRYQCLTVKAVQGGVKQLMAKAWIDGVGEYTLNWVPKPSEPVPANLKRVNLFREEEARLLIWYAAAKMPIGSDKNFPFEFTLNSEDFFTSDSVRLNKTRFDISIKFIAENYTDLKERKFCLNIESWDELNLTSTD